MEENKTNQEQQNLIDLDIVWRRFRPVLKRWWFMLVLLAMIGGGLMYLRARMGYHPMYQSEAIFSVSTSSADSTDITSATYYYDNSMAQQAVSTFPYLLNTDVMKEMICRELGTSAINGTITASNVSGTNFLTLTVTSGSAQSAYDICNAVMTVYPQIAAKVTGSIQLNVTQAPYIADEPYNSYSWQSSTLKGAVLLAGLGCVVLLLAAMSRQTVLSSADMKKQVNLSCLAHIPAVRAKARTKKTTANPVLITRQESDSAFSESFRLLSLKLRRELKDGENVILFTSTVPSEGKSSVAVNTALTIAKEGKMVLLIDGDLRGPSVKKILGIKTPSEGLAERLKAGNGRVQLVKSGVDNCWLLAGDEGTDNPIQVLRSEALQDIMASARRNFDYIIIDTPPCIMADASLFSAVADKVVYVVREDFAPMNEIFNRIQTLSENGAQLCGFVINCSTTGQGGHYGYGYGYGSGYGYGYGKGYGYGYGKGYGYGYGKGYGYSSSGSSKEADKKSSRTSSGSSGKSSSGSSSSSGHHHHSSGSGTSGSAEK